MRTWCAYLTINDSVSFCLCGWKVFYIAMARRGSAYRSVLKLLALNQYVTLGCRLLKQSFSTIWTYHQFCMFAWLLL